MSSKKKLCYDFYFFFKLCFDFFRFEKNLFLCISTLSDILDSDSENLLVLININLFQMNFKIFELSIYIILV